MRRYKRFATSRYINNRPPITVVCAGASWCTQSILSPDNHLLLGSSFRFVFGNCTVYRTDFREKNHEFCPGSRVCEQHTCCVQIQIQIFPVKNYVYTATVFLLAISQRISENVSNISFHTPLVSISIVAIQTYGPWSNNRHNPKNFQLAFRIYFWFLFLFTPSSMVCRAIGIIKIVLSTSYTRKRRKLTLKQRNRLPSVILTYTRVVYK